MQDIEDFHPGQAIEPQACSAWIAPSGRFHYVPDSSHMLVAPLLGATDEADPVRDLERKGWVHLSWTGIHTQKAPTSKQWDTLFDVKLILEANPVQHQGHNHLMSLRNFESLLRFLTERWADE